MKSVYSLILHIYDSEQCDQLYYTDNYDDCMFLCE